MSDSIWVEPIVLEGTRVKLEPLAIAHAQELARIADDGMFRFYGGFRPEGRDVRAGEEFVRRVSAEPNKAAFAIIDKASGLPVGATSFMDIKPQHRGLEIGSTWLATSAQGTYVNPGAKLLLLAHAFERLGAIRVQFRTDVRNLRSQRAIEKLGAKRDGIFRHDTIMPDGYFRDSVYYSILVSEWPSVKADLERRVESIGLR